jgi:ribosomal protein L20A (L18A)
MYKEYRDLTLNGAVEQMYDEMASRHRVRSPCIQIIKTATIPVSLCKRVNTKQFHDSKIKFPLTYHIQGFQTQHFCLNVVEFLGMYGLAAPSGIQFIKAEETFLDIDVFFTSAGLRIVRHWLFCVLDLSVLYTCLAFTR